MSKASKFSPVTYVLVLKSHGGQVVTCVPTIQDLQGARKFAASTLALTPESDHVDIHDYVDGQMVAEPLETIQREEKREP